MRCNHKRIKKNYPHGRKSTPIIFCKDCGMVIKKMMLHKNPIKRKKLTGIRKRKINGQERAGENKS